MAENMENVVTSKPKAGGCVWSAPVGTKLPTDATSAIDASFKCLGYISEDGVAEAIEGDSENTRAYGGDEVLVVQTSHSVTYTYTPIETNPVVLAETYGEDNVTSDESGGTATAKVNSTARKPRSYVYEHLLSNNEVERIVVPRGQVTSIGERVHKTGSPVGSQLTTTAFPDESGNKAYHYFAKAVAA